MILHRIEYNGGEVWVDLTAKRIIGSYYTGQGFAGMSVFKWSESQFKSFPDHKGVVVAQSTNLSLPNIPYVEIEENVKELAEQWFEKDFLNRNYFYVNHEELQKGFIQGYKAASAKKYTEEDLRKVMLEYAKWVTGGVPSLRFASTQEEAMSKIIQSLKPKVVSIEVEMIQKGCCWNNPANCICEHKGENMRNNGFNGKLYDPIPVTYTKGGKTFVKVKKVNYES